MHWKECVIAFVAKRLFAFGQSAQEKTIGLVVASIPQTFHVGARDLCVSR